MEIEAVLIRHLEDDNDLRSNGRDTDLKASEREKAATLAECIAKNAVKSGKNKVFVMTSPKRRTITTAQYAVASLPPEYDQLKIVISQDNRIRELDQGDYVLPPNYVAGDFFPPLQNAWDAYFQETFCKGNLYYRFGDPLVGSNGAAYPQLVGHFNSFGEHQAEFSVRFYSFLSEFIQRFSGEADSLPILVTHQAIIARMLENAVLAHNLSELSPDAIAPGRLPILEWSYLEAIKLDLLAVGTYGGNTTLAFPVVDNYLSLLQGQMDFLKQGNYEK